MSSDNAKKAPTSRNGFASTSQVGRTPRDANTAIGDLTGAGSDAAKGSVFAVSLTTISALVGI
ncbi:hypothetical protein MSEO_29390 [Mycobacterium seoulense]|uniref:Uncharacterized protein n=1 Tax=Mycobacterium seoulense TaxID=386911 RepID=A0A7I7P1P3_9MYCO|nr:hypothetical protein MSEO_29390 [Mycobacterium seoulense]